MYAADRGKDKPEHAQYADLHPMVADLGHLDPLAAALVRNPLRRLWPL